MQTIAPRAADALVKDHKAVLLDIRSEDEFADSHLPGAMLVPNGEIDEALAATLEGRDAIFYCTSGMRTMRAANDLEQGGLSNPKILEGGLNSWISAGLPVVNKHGEHGVYTISIPRQVQITVGTLILIFATLAWLGVPFAPLVLGAIGLGLLSAGLTGTCALATVIMMMPWNRSKSGG